MNRHRRRAAAKLGGRGNPDITAIPPDVSALFGVAVMHHKTGELAKAEAFYRHLLHDSTGASAALGAAMRSVLSRDADADPALWAAFQVSVVTLAPGPPTGPSDR